jgi:hypothetical protein
LQDAAESRPQISGLMALLYTLAMGSLWFLRLDDLPLDEAGGGAAIADNDFTDMPG